MKWLDRFFGAKQEETKAEANRPVLLVNRYGQVGELKKAVEQYIANSTGPFTIRDVSAAIGHFDPLGRGLHKTVHRFEKKGLVKVLPREKGALMTWEKIDKKPEAAIVKRACAKSGMGKATQFCALQFLQTASCPVTADDVRSALGIKTSKPNDAVWMALKSLSRTGVIRELGRKKVKGSPILWEAVQTTSSKTPPVPLALVSKPITVPFYFDAEFRVVTKRDKRLIALIEQKKADSLGKEKWEPAETNIRVYQQALKAVCGELINHARG